MAACRMSSSEALRRGINAGKETPQGIMALGALIDTFVSGAGCSTAQPECRPFDPSRRGCLPVRCNHQRTLSWDDSTLDTMEASEESSNGRSSHKRSKSPSDDRKKEAVGFLKRKKSEEDLSLSTMNRKPSDESSSDSYSRSVMDTEQPKEKSESIWSKDLFSSSFDELQRSLSLEQAYGQSIFRDNTMESVENTVDVEPEVPITSTKPPHLRRQSTPSPLQAQSSSIADALQTSRSIQRHSTPQKLGKKPRLISPDSTPKAHNSHQHRRAASSSPIRSRSLLSFQRSQSQQSTQKSNVPKDQDSIRKRSSTVETLESWSRQQGQDESVTATGQWSCSENQNQQPKTSFWNLEFQNFFCGHQGVNEAEASMEKATKVNTAATMEDSILTAATTETTSIIDQAKTVIPTTTTPNDMPQASVSSASTEQPFLKNLSHDSDVLAKASVEQTLQDESLGKKKNPFQAMLRTTTGILSKFSIEYMQEDPHSETPVIKTTETHDTDIVAKASVEESLKGSNVLDMIAPNDDKFHTTEDGTSQNLCDDQSCDRPSLGQNKNGDGHENISNDVLESSPFLVNNDRLEDIDQQVKFLVSRIRQLEDEIKETKNRGQEEDGQDPDMMNNPSDMEIHADESLSFQEANQKLEQTTGNENSSVGLDEQSNREVVPDEEMLSCEDVLDVQDDVKATNSVIEENFELTSNLLETSGACSTIEADNSIDEEYAEDDGIEVDLLDFVHNTDRIMDNQDVGNLVAIKDDLKQEEEEEGIEILMIDQQIANTNYRNQADKSFTGDELQSSTRNNANSQAESSNEEVNKKANKYKKGGVVRGLKKTLMRVRGPRPTKSRMNSTIEGNEVMPMTGVYGGLPVGSDVSSVSSLVSTEGRSTMKRPRGRYGKRPRSCEVSLSTGTTTLPTSNVIKSVKE